MNLTCRYLGMNLVSPIVVGASSLSKTIQNIKSAEDAGAGALVIKSLFEEQLMAEAAELASFSERYADMIGESLSFHPEMEHGGPREHLMWIEKTRKVVSMPLIASLNAISPGAWLSYAGSLVSAGVDALELNFYGIVTDPDVTEHDVLQMMAETVSDLKSKVGIPVSVKLSPYLTVPGYTVKVLEEAGADGVVMFNRYVQPDIDIENLSVEYSMILSNAGEVSHSLRWIALLFDRVNLDLCAASGVHTSADVIKLILAGADAVQVVSALYLNGFQYIRALADGVKEWMSQRGYGALSDFRGLLSQAKTDDPYAYERSQYIKALLGFD